MYNFTEGKRGELTLGKTIDGGKRWWHEQFVLPVKQSKILKWFWIIGLTFGLLMVFLKPPLSGFDATTHFRAVVFYAEGGHTAPKASPKDVMDGYLDKETADAIDVAGAVQAQKQVSPSNYYQIFTHGDGITKEKRAVDLSGAAVYSPVAYAPSIAGVFLTRLLHVPILFQIWVARIFCLVTYLVLVYFALRLLPIGKWAFFVIALLPMALFQAAAITTDGFLNGLTFLFVALLLNLILRPAITDRKKLFVLLGVLAAVGMGVALSKPTYVILAALVALVPVRHFGRNRYKWFYVAGVVGVMGFLALAWNAHVKDMAIQIGEVYRTGFYVSYDAQLHWVVQHPFGFLTAIGRAILFNSYNYFGEMLGTFDTDFRMLPVVVTLPLVVLTFLGIAVDRRLLQKLNVMTRVGFIAVALTVVGAIFATFYLTYTPVGQAIVDGIQGRYFLPLLVLLIPMATYKQLHIKIDHPERVFVPFVALALIVSSVQIPYVTYLLH